MVTRVSKPEPAVTVLPHGRNFLAAQHTLVNLAETVHRAELTRRNLLLALTATVVARGLVFADKVQAMIHPRHDSVQNREADQGQGLLGRWRSTKFRKGLLCEWADASSCELLICHSSLLSREAKRDAVHVESVLDLTMRPNSPYVIRLQLSNGRATWLAPDTLPGWIAKDHTLRFGPLGSHLVFTYRLDKDLLILVRGREYLGNDAQNRGDIVLTRSPRDLLG